MRVNRRGSCAGSIAVLAALSCAACLPGHAADLAPILQGSGPFSWAGLYAGANVGGGWGRTFSTATLPSLSTLASDENKGFTGGFQGGYNWQNGALVAGLEADIQFSKQQNSVNVFDIYFINDISYFSTFRGRIGWAFDDWLLYVTGGGGFGGNRQTVEVAEVGTFGSSDTSGLWTLGGGVETQIWGRWTAKLEYLYLDYGSISNNFSVPGGTLAVNRTVHDNVVRTGFNYHF